ncbi:MAG TPA: nucleoside hydrolase [Mesorhizobium sp.]|uniref:nucleoside hydrolase n=1 Tax=Mesorhizobium sp. TaxID=1871066 RepID=UPI002DDC9B6D|nr:nucleoside hydrolase [Mesorhizobium sp.]HEV2506869.1 nucleoside hydrolase [Mesorhizobium sp.]
MTWAALSSVDTHGRIQGRIDGRYILQMKRFIAVLLAAAGSVLASMANAAPEKIILDTDFSTIGDDGQTLIMAAQLQKEGVIELLGVTVVTGNNWLKQEVADALRAVERLGIDEKVGVYAGANLPLVHDPRSFEHERALFGFGESYKTAFHRPQPTDKDLIAPPDGFATKAKLRQENAVDFIIHTVKANPGEVSLLVIGPATNIALAIRKNPEIVPLIKRIVYMAGAVDVKGNTTPAAEMNVWIDPEAARIVMREPVAQALIPLDVTDITQIGKAEFDRIVAKEGPVQKLLGDSWMAKRFAKDANAKANVFDTLALAYLVDPTFATKVEDLYVDVDVAYGPSYGRTLGYWKEQPTPLLQKVKVVKEFDNKRFNDFYVDLLTRPVPVAKD